MYRHVFSYKYASFNLCVIIAIAPEALNERSWTGPMLLSMLFNVIITKY